MQRDLRRFDRQPALHLVQLVAHILCAETGLLILLCRSLLQLGRVHFDALNLLLQLLPLLFLSSTRFLVQPHLLQAASEFATDVQSKNCSNASTKAVCVLVPRVHLLVIVLIIVLRIAMHSCRCLRTQNYIVSCQ